MSASPRIRIRVWTVTADSRKWSFDSLDLALSYLRAELANNGALAASIESSMRTPGQYRRAVEREDSDRTAVGTVAGLATNG